MCKGWKKCVINKDLKFGDYKSTLYEQKLVNKSMNLFKSNLHKVLLYTILYWENKQSSSLRVWQ